MFRKHLKRSVATLLFIALFFAVLPTLIGGVLSRKYDFFDLKYAAFNPFTFTASAWGVNIKESGFDCSVPRVSVNLQFWESLAEKRVIIKKVSVITPSLDIFPQSRRSLSGLTFLSSHSFEVKKLKLDGAEVHFSGERALSIPFLNVSVFNITEDLSRELKAEIELQGGKGALIKLESGLTLSPLKLQGNLDSSIPLNHLLSEINKDLPLRIRDAEITTEKMNFLLAFHEGKPELEFRADKLSLSHFRLEGIKGKLFCSVSRLSLQDVHFSSEENLFSGSKLSANLDSLRFDRSNYGRLRAKYLFDFTRFFEKHPYVKTAVDSLKKYDVEISQTQFDINSLLYSDSSFYNALEISLENISASMGNISKSEPGVVEVVSGVNSTGKLKGVGELSLSPLGITGDVNLKSIPLRLFGHFINRVVWVDTEEGVVDGDVVAQFGTMKSGEKRLKLMGSAHIYDMKLIGKYRAYEFAECETVILHDAYLDFLERELYVDSADVNVITLPSYISKAGVNSTIYTIKNGGTRHPNYVPLDKYKKRLAVNARIITMKDLKIPVVDSSQNEVVEFSINKGTALINDFTTSRVDPISFRVTGEFDEGSELKVSGSLSPYRTPVESDFILYVSDLELTPFSPYFTTYTGMPVASGVAQALLDYRFTGKSIEGHNRIVTKGFSFGNKTGDTALIKAPFKLGVSILSDREGKMELDIPVKGELDNMDFSLSSTIAKAVGKSMGKVVTAPFTSIGKKRQKKDMRRICFHSGGDIIQPDELFKFAELHTYLVNHPSLKLLISPQLDSSGDLESLRKEQLLNVLKLDSSEKTYSSLFHKPNQQILFDYYEKVSGENVEKLWGKFKKKRKNKNRENDKLLYVEFTKSIIMDLLKDIDPDDEFYARLKTKRFEKIKSELLSRGIHNSRLEQGDEVERGKRIKSSVYLSVAGE